MAKQFTNACVYFPDASDLVTLRRAAKVRGVALGTLMREAAVKEAKKILSSTSSAKRAA